MCIRDSLQVVVFTLLQIPYGILFALLIGFTTLIPYASALTITLISIVLTVEDPRTGLEVLAAAISVGQVVDQVIAPRLVGTIVGLHPAWVLFSLPVGSRLGALLGCGQLLGLLLAVPLASGTASSKPCLLYTSPSPRDRTRSRMPSSA